MHGKRVESYPMWQVRRQASRLDGQPKLDKRGRVNGLGTGGVLSAYSYCWAVNLCLSSKSLSFEEGDIYV